MLPEGNEGQVLSAQLNPVGVARDEGQLRAWECHRIISKEDVGDPKEDRNQNNLNRGAGSLAIVPLFEECSSGGRLVIELPPGGGCKGRFNNSCNYGALETWGICFRLGRGSGGQAQPTDICHNWEKEVH